MIAKVKETIPNKPIKYLVNTHVHFDHSGGLRTFVDEGATIVTHEDNKPYYEKAWAAPHTINPDKLAQSKKTATFETFSDKHVLTDGSRTIEIHKIAGGGHNDAFAMIYLPKEKILIEGDAWTPPAANAPPPAAVNPFAVNLDENITRLKLDVKQIAALHGPRVATSRRSEGFQHAAQHQLVGGWWLVVGGWWFVVRSVGSMRRPAVMAGRSGAAVAVGRARRAVAEVPDAGHPASA